MSSDSEEEDHEFALYGTLLDPLEEDTVQAKKPISIQDQIATDKHGKRRFHGAFTGGFSAGFCNTVGSLEGWTPSTFKSSRSTKDASSVAPRKPEDFMDDEDMSAFGIAPKSIQVSSSFEGKAGEGQKRQRGLPGTTIPGVPVLQSLLQPVSDTIGTKLLSRMGWKPGQGIGPRLTKQDKRLASNQDKARRKIYGCSLPGQDQETKGGGEEEEEVEEDESGLTYAPDEYLPYLVKPKDNEFGLEYKGLDRKPVLSNEKRGFSLFDESDVSGGGLGDTGVTFIGRNNKKIRIQGQAFGVGAFEEEDDDIYATDDMSRYDFSLAPSGSRTNTKSKKPDPTSGGPAPAGSKDGEVAGFRKSETECLFVKVFPPPQLPPNYVPKCPFSTEQLQLSNQSLLGLHQSTNQSLFGLHQSTNPSQPTSLQSQSNPFQNSSGGLSYPQSVPIAGQNQSIPLDQSDHPIKQARSAFERAAILDEPLPVVRPQPSTSENKERDGVKGWGSSSNRGPNSSSNVTTNDPDSSNSRAQDHTLPNQGVETTTEQQTLKDTPTHHKGQPQFRPFASEPEKQTRYETYVNFVKIGLRDKLSTLQPKSMTEWERQREANEFESAQKLYTPLSGAMADRFTHGSQPDDINPLVKTERFAKDAADETLRQAAKNKMFGKLTREHSTWVPSDLLCKRFNIKPPAVIEARKRQRQNRNYSLFEFLNEEKSGIVDGSNSGTGEKRCVDNSQTQMSSEQSTVHRTNDNSQSGTNNSQSGTNNAQSGTNNSQSDTDNSQSNNRVSQNDRRDNKTISRLPNPLRDEDSVARLKEQSVLSGQPMGTRLEDIPLTAENKVDLFKAIFLSSDEEEDEDEKKEEDKDKKTEDRTGGVELETPGEPDKTNEKVDSNNEKVVVTKEKTNEKTGKVNTKDKNTEEVKDNPMKTMEMTSKENEGRENEKTGEINNVEDLYGPKLPGQLSKQVEDNVGSVGEVVNINNAQTNTTNSGLGLLGALENDRMSVSKKRNTEVVGVRFEKPNKIGKDKNHTSRTSILQESKQELETEGSEMEDKVESGGDIVGSQEVGGEPSDVVVIVKEEEEEDDDEDMWVDADEINAKETEQDRKKPSDKSSKHKKTDRKSDQRNNTDDRNEKRDKKRSKKTKRKTYSDCSSSDEEKRHKSKRKDADSSDEEAEAKGRKSKRKNRTSSFSDSDTGDTSQDRRTSTRKHKTNKSKSSKRKHRDSSSSCSEYEKRRRRKSRRQCSDDGTSESDKGRSVSRDRKHKSKYSKRKHKKHRR